MTINMNINNTLAQKIFLIRERSSFTQHQLAILIGTSVGRISAYELGEGRPKNDSMRKLIDIGKKFDVEFDIYDMLSAQDFKEKKAEAKVKKNTAKKIFTDILNEKTSLPI